MTIEFSFALAIMTALLLLALHTRWTATPVDYYAESVEVGHITVELPPPQRHDILDDYAAEMNFQALTTEGSVEHRLALMEALLQEADHESDRLSLLVDKLGYQLAPAA